MNSTLNELYRQAVLHRFNANVSTLLPCGSKIINEESLNIRTTFSMLVLIRVSVMFMRVIKMY